MRHGLLNRIPFDNLVGLVATLLEGKADEGGESSIAKPTMTYPIRRQAVGPWAGQYGNGEEMWIKMEGGLPTAADA